MVKTKPRYNLLVEGIEKYFREGIELDHDVLHFIDSTFSNPSLKEFIEILMDESNLERESLMELLFSPDEWMQVQLEGILIDEDFEKDDEKEISHLLCSKKISTHIVFPDSRGTFDIHIPDQAMSSFISKLNIYWKPDDPIVKTLDPISGKAAVTVRLRNKKVRLSKNKRYVLCLFLERMDMENPLFFNCLDYLLDTMDGISDTHDVYETLSQRKLQYNDAIGKRKEFERLLAKSNLETLSQHGIHAPFVNIADMQKRIEMIDTITLAVYGKIVYCL